MEIDLLEETYLGRYERTYATVWLTSKLPM
jgi:hypothetical protein